MPAERVRLEVPSSRHRAEFLAAVARSRRLHRPWVAPPATAAAFAAWLARGHGDRARSFLVRAPGGDLAGVVNLSEIVRGSFRSAYLGYYAFVPYAGQGIMRQGLALVLDRAFGRLRLHRVEANVQPGNEASLALVRRLGFRREGYSPRYLKIAGRWRDHERWALLVEEWRAGRVGAVCRPASNPAPGRVRPG